MSEETLKVQIDRFKTADVEREVLKLATMASNITFVQQLIEKVDELEKQLKEANDLLLGFLDENICSFDHNGYCQEHSSTEPDYRCIQQQLKWYFKKYEVLK
jgi:hypothetical protein